MDNLRFDATDDVDLLPFPTWEYMRDRWWVCVFKPRVYGLDEAARPWAWCQGPREPRPVPNTQMYWRRPTYDEAMNRWRWMRDKWDRQCEKWAEGYAQYRRG